MQSSGLHPGEGRLIFKEHLFLLGVSREQRRTMDWMYGWVALLWLDLQQR